MGNKFKIGDVVQLKSGGLAMTVSKIQGIITCAWFDKDYYLREANFNQDALMLRIPPVPGYVVTDDCVIKKNNIEQESTI